MSTAELKLELIRAIDKLPQERLEVLLKQVHETQVFSEQEPRLRFGALKGMLLYMAPDFDAPLEDFKDYM